MARANLAGRVPAEDARLRPRNSAPSGTATGEHGFDDVSPDVRIIGPTRVRAGWGFVSSYALSFAGNALVFIAPLLVTLALKVDDLVGIHAAPKDLALVTGTGSILAMISNPLFGRFIDRTTARLASVDPGCWSISPAAQSARSRSRSLRTS